MKRLACLKEKRIECIVFFLFAVSLAIVSIFHEPWFDEAQAWQIARCASLKEILFEIPHYEGHPALWHLMLLIPAKLGFPYEFTMGFVAYVAIFFTGWLILFKSPFPLLVKCLLPFHYFIFYQHGVVSRPYGYMTLAFMLLALTFRERDKHPWRFILGLAFLCALSGYGIVLAGGIAAVWFFEECCKSRWKFSEIWKDKSIVSLGALLIFAILLMFQIMPRQNTYAFSIERTNRVGICVLYTFFAMLPDSTLVNVLNCEDMPRYSNFNMTQLMIAVIVGCFFLLCIYLYSTKKNGLYFVIPYFIYVTFTGFVYFSSHHLGIILAFVIFWLWIASEDDNRGYRFKKIYSKLNLSEENSKALKKLGVPSAFSRSL